MSFAAGRLKHTITVRRGTDTSDGKGGYTTAWATVATLPAEVVSVNGREGVIDKALQGISSYRITTRFGPTVQTADQILYEGNELNVRTADDPDGLRQRLVIFADTETPRGA